MPTTDQFFDDNRKLWDARTRVHLKADREVEVFRAGELTIAPPETEEIGDVAGKTLLHLQCHFGLDTLSYARLGALVTGVDFSSEAIAAARNLAEEAKLDARFVESNVYDVPSAIDGEFDIVYTSHGVVWWLPDLVPWAQVIARMLKPGGVFYICEDHPVAMCIDQASDSRAWKYDYFREEPYSEETDRTYVGPEFEVERNMEHGWLHDLGDVITALTTSGLQVEFLHEHPTSAWRVLPGLVQTANGWTVEAGQPQIPLRYSIRALKPVR